MQPNDVLRRLRYALNLRDAELAQMMSHRGEPATPEQLEDMLRPDGDPALLECSSEDLGRTLDGLIIARRGPPPKDRSPWREHRLDNNAILQKLRIAMSFREADVLGALAAGGLTVGKQELSALFRSPGHRNWRPCGDQLLKAFLAGLAKRSREDHRSE